MQHASDLIEHQPDRCRFVAEVDGQECVCDYTLQGKRVNFTHTFVPTSLRGSGLAEQLVASALSWARAENCEIEASCWYVRRFLDD